MEIGKSRAGLIFLCFALAVISTSIFACGGGGGSGPTSLSCDLYVDAPLGSDDNAGTAGSPFQSITFALSQASSGEVVCVAAGTHDEALGETFPITVPSGVTLTADGTGQKPVIQGGGDSGSVNIALITSNNSTIHGFSINVPSDVDPAVVHVGIYSDTGFPVISHNTISGVSLSHWEGAGVATYGLASPQIINNTIINNHNGIATYGTSAPVIRQNILTDNESHAVYAAHNSDPDLGTSLDPGDNIIQDNGYRGLGNFTDGSIIDAAGNTWTINCSTADGSYATTLVVAPNPVNDNDLCQELPSNYYIKYTGAGIQF
jgi:parallel beta-helix repeat protein